MFKKIKGLLTGLKIKIENAVEDSTLGKAIWNTITFPFGIGDAKNRLVEKVKRHIQMRMRYSDEELKYIKKEFVEKILKDLTQDEFLKTLMEKDPTIKSHVMYMAEKYADEFIQKQKRPEIIQAMNGGKIINPEALFGKNHEEIREYGQTFFHGYKPPKELRKYFDMYHPKGLYGAILSKINTEISSDLLSQLYNKLPTAKGKGIYVIQPEVSAKKTLPIQQIAYDFNKKRFVLNVISRNDKNLILETKYAKTFDELKSMLFKGSDPYAINSTYLNNVMKNLIDNNVKIKHFSFFNILKKFLHPKTEEKQFAIKSYNEKAPVEKESVGITKENTKAEQSEIPRENTNNETSPAF